MTEVCGSFHALGGMTCIRPKGHDGRCWCKWSPVTGAPGYATRGEWAMDGGFYHCGYVVRKLAHLAQQTGATFYGMGDDEGEEWKA